MLDVEWLVDRLVEIHEGPTGDKTLRMQLFVLLYSADVAHHGSSTVAKAFEGKTGKRIGPLISDSVKLSKHVTVSEHFRRVWAAPAVLG